MQFGQDLSLQLSPQTHENQPRLTKIALESPFSRGNCELKSWPNGMDQKWILLYFKTPFKWCTWILLQKSPSMLVFCIIYCRDIYDISLFGKFLPSNSKPNTPNFYLYNLFGVIWCWFEWEQAISMCFHTFDRH